MPIAFGLPGRKRIVEIVLALVMVAVIAGAYWVYRDQSDYLTPEHMSRRNKMHFHCVHCSHEFLVNIWDLPAGYARGRVTGQSGIACPRCGGKDTAYPDIECPNCGTWFFTRESFAPPPFQPPEGAHISSKCPKCGVDPVQWRRDHAGGR